MVRQLTPVIEQLLPIYTDIAKGTREFVPSPAECKDMIREGKGVDGERISVDPWRASGGHPWWRCGAPGSNRPSGLLPIPPPLPLPVQAMAWSATS